MYWAVHTVCRKLKGHRNRITALSYGHATSHDAPEYVLCTASTDKVRKNKTNHCPQSIENSYGVSFPSLIASLQGYFMALRRTDGDTSSPCGEPSEFGRRSSAMRRPRRLCKFTRGVIYCLLEARPQLQTHLLPFRIG